MSGITNLKPVDGNNSLNFGAQNLSAQNLPSSVPVGQGKTTANLEELLKKLGIDLETYQQLCDRNENFTILPFEEQQKIVAEVMSTVTPVLETDTVENNADKASIEHFSHTDELINTSIKAANYANVDIDEFKNLQPIEQEDIIYNYLINLDENNLSDSQKEYVKEHKLIANILSDRLNKEKDIISDDINDNMLPSDIEKYCEKLGVTKWELLIDAKKYLRDNDKTLTKAQKKEIKHEIKHLRKADSLAKAVKKRPLEGYGRLEEFNNTTGVNIISSPDYSVEQKVDKLLSYMDKTFGELDNENLDRKERKQILEKRAEFISDIIAEDGRLGYELQSAYLRSCNKHDKEEVAGLNIGYTQDVNSLAINEFGQEAAKVVAETQKVIAQTDAERATDLATMTLDFADNEHLQATSETYAEFGIKEVEDKHAEVALDKERVDAETQKIMLENTFKYSNDETAKNTGIRLDEAYKENQLDLYNSASQREVVKEAMIENGTYSRLSYDKSGSDVKSQSTSYSENTTNYNTVKHSLEYNNLTPAAKNAYDKLEEADRQNVTPSKEEFIKMFSKLTDNEKSNLMASLPPKIIAKLPVKICEKFPSLIPQMVNAGRGLEILQSCSTHTFGITVNCMKGSDNTRKQLNNFIAENPAFFTKTSQEAAKAAMGETEKKITKPLMFKA